MRYPNIEADLRRAQAEQDHESLAIHINRRLYKDGAAPGDHDAMAAIVAELAPGWDYADASIVGQDRARVELTLFNPPK